VQLYLYKNAAPLSSLSLLFRGRERRERRDRCTVGVSARSQSLIGVLAGEQGLALGGLVGLGRRRGAVVEPVVIVVPVVVVGAEEAIGLRRR
jgi:hypothetical protein